MRRTESHRAAAAALGVALLALLACVARFVHLDADPMFPSWVGYITDEGRWNESARNLALFGTTNAFADRIHLLLSPVYQAVAFVVFKLNGVSLWSARLSAAVAGCAIVVLVGWSLRRHVTPLALAVGVLILGFESFMLAESRMALPEIPAALGVLVCALILVLAPPQRRYAALAGAVLVVALGLKGTMALVAPALFAVAVVTSDKRSWQARLQRLGAFTAGVAFVAALGVAGALMTQVLPPHKLLTLGDRLLSFISLTPLRQWVWDLFESQEQAVRNLLLLVFWAGSWVWLHRVPGPASVAHRLYLASAVWGGWSALIWGVNAYAPGRYVVHVIVPATLHLMAVLSLADPQTPARIAARLRRCTGASRGVWLAWLVLPAAVVAAALLVGMAALLGVDLSRLSVRAVLIVCCATVFAWWAHRAGTSPRAVSVLLLAPALGALAWYLGWDSALLGNFWESEPKATTLLWLLACGMAVVAAALHVNAAAERRAAIHLAIVLAAATLLLVRATLPLLTPTFTIRDASRDLGRLLPPLMRDEIVVHSASTLFLDNTLRYRELFEEHEAIEWLLVFENNGNARRALQRVAGLPTDRYRIYALNFDPRYTFDPRDDGPVQAVLLHRGPASAPAAAQPASAPGAAAR